MKKIYIFLFFLLPIITFSNTLKSQYDKIKHSVVSIIVNYDNVFEEYVTVAPYYFKDKIYKGIGSGFFVNNNGEILTCYHVIKGAREIYVQTEGKRYEAEIIGYDSFTDIALLKIDIQNNDFLKISEDDNLNMGDKIWCVGYPLNIGLIITSGIINSSRPVFFGMNFYERYIRCDAPLNPGASGGPILNIKGEVIGISEAKLHRLEQGEIEKTNFCIAAAVLRRIYEKIKQTQKNLGRYLLGMAISSNDRGIVVTDLLDNFPAELSEIKPGDIILEVDNVSFDNPTVLQDLIYFSDTSKIYRFKIDRFGKIFNIEVESHYVEPDFEIPPFFILSHYAGIYLDRNTFTIKKIKKDSIAEKSGIPKLKNITYIVSGRHFKNIKTTKIKNKDDFTKAIRESILTYQIGFALGWGTSLYKSRIFVFSKIYPIII